MWGSHSHLERFKARTAVVLSMLGWVAVNLPAGLCAAETFEPLDPRVEISTWSFRNQVQPVLAKAGCNAGACHGAAAGQNGFKLSLRGYDDEGDYLALTRQASGRRIFPGDPGKSLLLLKPTATVPHKGGKRFDTNSLEYKIISGWIAAGAPGPRVSDPRIVRIQLLPSESVLKPGDTNQLTVRAHFSDGHSDDVTRWAKFTDANSAVTQVEWDPLESTCRHASLSIL